MYVNSDSSRCVPRTAQWIISTTILCWIISRCGNSDNDELYRVSNCTATVRVHCLIWILRHCLYVNAYQNNRYVCIVCMCVMCACYMLVCSGCGSVTRIYVSIRCTFSCLQRRIFVNCTQDCLICTTSRATLFARWCRTLRACEISNKFGGR